MYANDESDNGVPDISTIMRDVKSGEHVYCCGPGGLLDAVSEYGRQSGIPSQSLHFERFAASPVEVADTGDKVFTIVLAKRGVQCVVESNESILESLERTE
ncbi:hypothetical protein [Paraburkholderia hospita]|uniref:hypothetical protein n=1 Tax=Paraburkholderia hospita TaxID=169430 RepID=UPI0010568E48|nr:hypothetical protein [Paraburkholderia hospita]